MARFTLPRDVYHGKGCLSELKNLKGKKAVLVVGGGSMKRQGFLDKAVNYLKEGGMEVKLIDVVRTAHHRAEPHEGRASDSYGDSGSLTRTFVSIGIRRSIAAPLTYGQPTGLSA